MPMDRYMRTVRRPLAQAAVEEPRETVELEVAPVPLSAVNEPQEETSQAPEGTETPVPEEEDGNHKEAVPDPGADFSLAASLIE